MMLELKNCPFCGGYSKLKSSFTGHWAECKNCFVATGISDSREGAISAWNRRLTNKDCYFSTPPRIYRPNQLLPDKIVEKYSFPVLPHMHTCIRLPRGAEILYAFMEAGQESLNIFAVIDIDEPHVARIFSVASAGDHIRCNDKEYKYISIIGGSYPTAFLFEILE